MVKRKVTEAIRFFEKCLKGKGLKVSKARKGKVMYAA